MQCTELASRTLTPPLLTDCPRSNTRSYTTREQGAVQHSGDVLDHERRSGLHTISIDLSKLGDHVAEMWITMSSFAGAKLSDIEQPFVQVGAWGVA